MSADSRRVELRAAVRREVPERPGVYTWLGRDGERLYIGKSLNLRQRMLSYLAAGRAGPESRQRHLVSAIAGFDWRETPGELLALLLEDALIKRFNPRHNERQRDYLERRYVLLTDDAFRACLVVESEPTRPGALFGPFTDEYFARDLVALITQHFGLRACTDREPYRRSARFDLGTCPGPCRGAITPAGYQAIAARVRAFLDGDDGWITAHLEQAMAQAAEELRFEEAAALRDERDFCVRFASRQRFYRRFRLGVMTVPEPGRGLIYLFEGGELVAIDTSAGDTLAIPAELSLPLSDERFLLDRAKPGVLVATGEGVTGTNGRRYSP